MTYVIGRPFEAAQTLRDEKQTQEEARNAQSIKNLYRLALAAISKHTHTTVYMGKVEKKILSTDLMKILRDCRKRMDEGGAFSPRDIASFVEVLRKFRKMRTKTWLSVARLVRLRQLAYGERPAAPVLEESPQARSSVRLGKGQLKNMLILDKVRRRKKPVASILKGCRYQDPNSGERCGADCKGPYCEEHEGIVPRYNGRGSSFHALNLKEAGK